jgi:hypothetical protein
VLQSVQPEIGEPRGILMVEDTKYATLVFELIQHLVVSCGGTILRPSHSSGNQENGFQGKEIRRVVFIVDGEATCSPLSVIG